MQSVRGFVNVARLSSLGVLKHGQPVRSMASLSPSTKLTVKATAPVIAEYGYAITSRMYDRMFTQHPELKEVFNMTHQKEIGEGVRARQPQALAAALKAYAENIDNLGALTEAVERAAEKHVSLNVTEDQYGIVGENILAAIKDVLGDAATPEILKAWEEAYFFLADVFINREKELKALKAHAEGGWEGWRSFTVAKKVQESDEVWSIYLNPSDGGKVPTHLPGQYTAVRVKGPDFVQTRNYTLSMEPGSDYFRISVKREEPTSAEDPAGMVSNYLIDSVQPGTELPVAVPCGDFVLDVDHDKPIVLLSGGIGITPLLSMLGQICKAKVKNPVTMVNCVRSPSVEAMREEIISYQNMPGTDINVETLYSNGGEGILTKDLLQSVLKSKDSHFYFCGPVGFMQNVNGILTDLGVPESQIHCENFGPHVQLD